jgi:hypothetical protein
MSKTPADAAARVNVGKVTVPETAPAFERLQQSRKLTRQELKSLVELAREHGGEMVNVARVAGSDDDWCGTMWFRGPRPKRVGVLVEGLLERGYGIEIFPRGIINPDALQIDFRNQAIGI